MKTAKQWVDENSQSGAFDTVGSCKDAETLVEAIQKDVLKSFIQTPKGELEVICETVARLTEIRQRGCAHLSVENFAPDLLFTMLTTVRAASFPAPNAEVRHGAKDADLD